jgi:peptidoglycan/xylan/chitin deacetylase (PgdA/CDA1 family)
MEEQKGVLVLSLDFELFWGVHERKTIEDYKENLLGVRSVVPSVLRLFDEYRIHATWATVGLLLFAAREELIEGLPVKRPHYVNSRLSSYSHIDNVGDDEEDDPFHYAASLVKMIISFPGQEMGCHTFCHYFCLDGEKDIDAFKDDLEAAIRIAGKYELGLQSIVFPRNQFNEKYLSICKKLKIRSYRGNGHPWFYRTKSYMKTTLPIRVLRLADTYFNVSGHNCYSLSEIKLSYPYNIRASRCLRPYSNKLRVLEPLKLKRITSELTHAAQKGKVYHLWWHPHNFGVNQAENMSILKGILDHYLEMREIHGMQSLNMKELADRLGGLSEQP